MKQTLSKMLVVVILFLSSLPAFADRYHDEFDEYVTECSQVWNPRYHQLETVCEKVYTGRRYEVGPYARDRYCCVNDYYRSDSYYRNERYRGRLYRQEDYYDRRNRVGIQFHFRW